MSIECVINISEGRDDSFLMEVKSNLQTISGIERIHFDSNTDAHRTVITLIGTTSAIAQGAINVYEMVLPKINMNTHRGVHPRLGAVDVCPFVPLKNATINECVELSYYLGDYVGSVLGIPVYYYGSAAKRSYCKNLVTIRRGEFEKLNRKMLQEKWRPDVGPTQPHKTFGATVIGARNILIAFNVNLKSNDVSIAKKIAQSLRESGFMLPNGRNVPGKLPHVQAIGWEMHCFNCVQVSCNLMDYKRTSVKNVFDAICQEANGYGIDVSGSEIVGLVPSDAFDDINGNAEDYLKLESLIGKILNINTPKL